MLTIYGSKKSSNCTKVAYVAQLLGLEYEFKEIEMGKENKTEDFLKMHPAGKVPVINDDGFILFESGAIIKYLCNKAGSDMYPTELQKRAKVDQWLNFSTLHVQNAMSKVVWNRIFAPQFGMDVDEQSLKDGLAWLDRYLPIVNNQLATSTYLAGDVLTLADITLFTALEYAEAGSVDLSAYEALVKWRNTLKEQEFYTTVRGE